MVIRKILKKLTPEKIKKEIEAIQRIKLPPELQKWIKEYEKVGERNDFIWKWTYNVVQLITLPIVPKEYQKSLFETKSCALITFGVLINDVADKLRDGNLLNELLKVPFLKENIRCNRLDQKEKNYLLFTINLWKYVLDSIKRYPRCKEFKEIFDYDVLQILVSNQHDYLISTNHYFLNKEESWLYPPHTMGGMICGTLDLMCSLDFDIKELGTMREILWQAQKMARIGNWVSSWEREIHESDFTSGVFVYALDSGVVTIDDLEREDKLEIVRKIKNSKVENGLLKEWESSHKKINNLSSKIKTVDIDKFLSGLEKLLISELSSREHK